MKKEFEHDNKLAASPRPEFGSFRVGEGETLIVYQRVRRKVSGGGLLGTILT